MSEIERKFVVIDVADIKPAAQIQPLPEEFGRNLETLERARAWLTNPHNWHESRLHILKWNGSLCTVNREHGQRLIREPWDDGLPWAALYEQKRIKGGHGHEVTGSDGSSEPVGSSDE